MNLGPSFFKVLGRTGSVYELIDPRDGSCRYVGMTFNEEARSRDHRDKNKFQASLARWKDELFRLGVCPTFVVIERDIDPDDILEREKFWVAERRRSGARLLNRPAGRITRSDLCPDDASMLVADVCEDIRSLLSNADATVGQVLPKKTRNKIAKMFNAALDLKNSLPVF